jgi:hypothetical protein
MAGTVREPNTVGWHILEGYPWWPVFVCDQFKLRENLHFLGTSGNAIDRFLLPSCGSFYTRTGNGHKRVLKKAKDFPKDYAVAYFFGSHDLYVMGWTFFVYGARPSHASLSLALALSPCIYLSLLSCDAVRW